MLRVTEYFVKSLKVIRNYTLEEGVKSLLVFSCKWAPAISASRIVSEIFSVKQAVRLGGCHNMPPPLLTFTFDLLTLKSVWESHVTWGTPMQSFVFLGLLVFELEPTYATSDRQTDERTDERRTPMTA